MEFEATARAQLEFPIFSRSWEHYPSGRLLEQVAMIDRAGVETSLCKITDQDGPVEFSLRRRATIALTERPAEFAGSRFGYALCAREDFESLRREILAFVECVG